MNMNFKIISIDLNSPCFEQVIKLGEANRSTLGFLPRGAFEHYASKKQIIVAIDENTDNVLGYLLYRNSRQKMLASIVHLCISTKNRQRGIARNLFNELVKLTQKNYKAICVHCRVDYEANHLWPKLGFSAVNEIPGRSKEGSVLRVWWFDHNHPSLFSHAEQNSSKAKVAIDANVFFQLQHPEIKGNEESLPLLEPWLDVDIYITPEIYNEIVRNPDKKRRADARKFADTFKKTRSSDANFQKIDKELLEILPNPISSSDASDRRQLARTIAAGIPFFVTRDGPLLSKSDEIYEKFNSQIVRPADIILMQDEALHSAEYSPSRLAGSKIHLEKVRSQQSQQIIIKFLANDGETKANFNQKIQTILGKPLSYDSFVVKDFDEEIGFVVYGRQIPSELNIPVIRIKPSKISPIIAKYLINSAVLVSASEQRLITRVSDEFLPEFVSFELRQNGFFKVVGGWIKINLAGIKTVSELKYTFSTNEWPEYAKDLINQILLNLDTVNINNDTYLEIEKLLWPVKIIDLDIPTFIVPIKPQWAMHLFDNDIAAQDLFGSEPSLILNAENVYYRSGKPKILVSPGRILWYVSKGKGRYRGSMQIKACSFVDEVLIDKPKALFSKYKRLGIYKWSDVFGIAENNLDKELMVFKFSRTEIFTSPITFFDLQQIWKTGGKNFNVFSPLQITKERFFEIYMKGLKETK